MNGNKIKKYPLTNDIIFKAVYGREDEACKKALVAMLNVILDNQEERIASVEIKNPMNHPDSINGKLSVLDIRCTTDSGEIIGVEMQVKQKPDVDKRMMYYQAKKMGDSLNKSEEYASIKKVISICIGVENQFDINEVKKYHSIFRYKDIDSGKELSDVSEIHFLEISKIDQSKKIEEMSAIERYGLYLLYENEEDDIHRELVEAVKSFNDEVIVMTEPVLHYVTEDEKLREAAADREMFIWNQEVDKILADRAKEEVEKGQAELEKGKAELEKDKAELEKNSAELEKNSAELEKDKTELEKDKTELEKDKTELEKDKTELEKDKTELEKKKAELEKDKTEVEKNKAELEKAKAELEKQSTDIRRTIVENLRAKGMLSDEIAKMTGFAIEIVEGL